MLRCAHTPLAEVKEVEGLSVFQELGSAWAGHDLAADPQRPQTNEVFFDNRRCRPRTDREEGRGFTFSTA